MRLISSIVIFLWITTAVATTADASYEIVPGVKVGAIEIQSTKADVEKAYGKKNVMVSDIYLGEGESKKGLILFPNDKGRELEIAWMGDEEIPELIRISGEKSLWKTKEGIAVGTTLKELEKLNGQAFNVAGCCWDYGGVITSWNEGKLKGLNRKVFVHLDMPKSFLGDADFSSSNPKLQKANPKVHLIRITFH